MISIEEIQKLLKPDSPYNWKQNISGNEYVFDFELKKIPVIIKVLSTIPVDIDKPLNKNSDKIRIFAVVKNNDGKITGGLLKSSYIKIDNSWEKM